MQQQHRHRHRHLPPNPTPRLPSQPACVPVHMPRKYKVHAMLHKQRLHHCAEGVGLHVLLHVAVVDAGMEEHDDKRRGLAVNSGAERVGSRQGSGVGGQVGKGKHAAIRYGVQR